jgi:hypothetical protein
MHIVKSGHNLLLVVKFREMAEELSSKRAQTEMYRGVVDAGRRVKTPVQKAVANQMALKPGRYQSYVVANTRGVGRPGILAYDIFAVKGGIKAENYKGLRSVGAKSKLNKGIGLSDRGTVRSGVWNNPRIFKRSFEKNGNFYMMRSREAGVKAPRILWTHDNRSWQPRGPGGRFASTGQAKWGKVRQLYGPSLMEEIPQDDSAAIFDALGPKLLEEAVTKRMAKLMRF